MKLLKLLSITSIGVLTSLITSCHNQDADCPASLGAESCRRGQSCGVRLRELFALYGRLPLRHGSPS